MVYFSFLSRNFKFICCLIYYASCKTFFTTRIIKVNYTMNTQKFFKCFSIFFDPLLQKSQYKFNKNVLGFSGGQDSTFLFIYLFIINFFKTKIMYNFTFKSFNTKK